MKGVKANSFRKKEQLIFIEPDRSMSNASQLSLVNTVISPKVSLINNSYKSVQEKRKYQIKLV